MEFSGDDSRDRKGTHRSSGPEIGQTGARFGSPAQRRRMRARALDEEITHEQAAHPPTAAGVPVAPLDPEVGQTGARFGSPAQRRRMRAQAKAGDTATGERPAPPPTVADAPTSLGPDIGHPGAHFGSPAARQRMRAQPEDDTAADERLGTHGPPVVAVDQDPELAAFLAESRRVPVPDEAAVSGRASPVEARPDTLDEAWHDALDEALDEVLDDTPAPHRAAEAPLDGADAPSLVRPYAWTGGRTESRYDLRMETLVSVCDRGGVAALTGAGSMYRQIVEACTGPLSVAEVAAGLSVPLGVARVLLSDLIDAGALIAHDTAAGGDGVPDLAVLQRVLTGLRRL